MCLIKALSPIKYYKRKWVITIFIDRAKITVKAGNGGDGLVSFHREKYVNSGGPDGGDGGKGGNVVFVVDSNVSTLMDFRYKRNFVAKDGDRGGSRQCSGRAADDLIIKVPRGTLVRCAETGRLIADLSGTEPVIIAKGGKGGAGNQHFATPTRQIPRFAKPGIKGETFDLSLELKLLADVGLVGFPNVGKSTLISVVSAAKPVIANYHFTTITPVLGVVKVSDVKSFVMADIPGLIEGASDGVGLGHDFLRHVERCRLIVHIVDVSGIEGRNPIEDFNAINKELANFSPELAERKQIVAANKCDMATPEQIEEFKTYVVNQGYDFFEISAATTQGTKELVMTIAAQLEKLPPIKEYEPDPVIAPIEKANNMEFTAELVDGVYIVESEFIAKILESVNTDDYESLQYFQKMLRTSGIIDKLEAMGVDEGDTVNVCGLEFEFVF